MTLSEISTKVTELTGASTTAYPVANRVINANLWMGKIVSMILQSQDEADHDDANYGDYPILTTALTTNRDYAIGVSEEVLSIKRLDVTYNGSSYNEALPIDSAEIGFGLGNDTDTDSNFDKTNPRYDFKYGSIFLYPKASTADVASGGQLLVEWSRNNYTITAADWNTGTLKPGFDANFHGMLAYGVALDFAVANQIPTKDDIASVLQDYEVRLKKQYGRKQRDRQYTLEADYINYN